MTELRPMPEFDWADVEGELRSWADWQRAQASFFAGWNCLQVYEKPTEDVRQAVMFAVNSLPNVMAAELVDGYIERYGQDPTKPAPKTYEVESLEIEVGGIKIDGFGDFDLGYPTFDFAEDKFGGGYLLAYPDPGGVNVEIDVAPSNDATLGQIAEELRAAVEDSQRGSADMAHYARLWSADY